MARGCKGRWNLFVPLKTPKLKSHWTVVVSRRGFNSTSTLRDRSNSGALSLAGRPFRIGIIGGGPAGFYVATRLFTFAGSENIKVDLFELLPVPFGLSRYGVAPDHPEVKNCEHKFEQTARDPRFRFYGNVQITGEDVSPRSPSGNPSPPQTPDTLYTTSLTARIPLSSLRPYYDAIIFTYGASLDRSLGILGEDDSVNVLSARSFVNWYNGHPYLSSMVSPRINLSKMEHVTIIGQGNVALDVARLLLKPVSWLKGTDLPEYAMAELARSRVKKVDIVGRRGPLQLAATTKELREMLSLPGVGFEVDARALQEAEDFIKINPSVENARAKGRGLRLLAKGSVTALSEAEKSWSLKFLLSPTRFLPPEQPCIIETATPSGNFVKAREVAAVEYNINELKRPSNAEGVFLDPSNDRASPTGHHITTRTDMIFKSVGYRSIAIPGIPFDHKKGIILNENGRVMDTSRKQIPGLYTSGWVARGPSGVIATTMFDAFETADMIARDLSFEKQQSPRPEPPVKTLAGGKQTVSWEDWEKIDNEEKRRGLSLGKPREKITNVAEMLNIIA